MDATQEKAKASVGEYELAVEAPVFERHGGTHFAFLAVPAAPYDDPKDASRVERAVVDRLAAAFPSEEDLRGSGEDASYREFYRAMGLKAAQVSTPVKQALRVLRNGSYRSRGPVVDKAMAIEYTSLVSFQVYGTAAVAPRLSLGLAQGDEPIATTRGENKTCKAGELLLRSGEEVVHSCYYGNDPKFLLGEGDRFALVRVMGVPGLPADRFDEALREAIEQMAPIDTAILDESSPTGRLSLNPRPEGGRA